MTNIIQFINTSEFKQEHLPEPAVKVIPEWFREAPTEISNKHHHLEHVQHSGILKNQDDKKVIQDGPLQSIYTSFTIKKCMPVFDAMTVGYLLKFAADIEVYQAKIKPEDEEVNTMFSWGPAAQMSAHGLEQVEGYPHNKVHKRALPKFINQWIIKTPPGWSCLFITPMHRDLPFEILPGIVDTDTFDHCVNIPFQMKTDDFDGTLKAGSPMVQVIPFKRETFSMEVYDGYEYVEKHPDTSLFLKLFPDSYKKNFWHKKDYK